MPIDWPATHLRRSRLAMLEAKTAPPARRSALLRVAHFEAREARDAIESDECRAEFLAAHPQARRALGLDEKATARGAA
jgi:hypothetical protein